MKHLSFSWLLILLLASLTLICRAETIHDAAMRGDVMTVRRLLQENPVLKNARTPGGATPLLVSAIHGQLEVAQLLVESGADVNLPQGDGWTPLHAAVCDGNNEAHVQITRLLLAHGAKMDARNMVGWTPLHVAALKGNIATMKVLLDNNALLDAQDDSGSTPLHLAVEQNQPATTKSLLDKGANVNLRDKSGKTPLEQALLKGSSASLDQLLTALHVTLDLEGVTLQEGLQQLFAKAKAPYTAAPELRAVVSAHLHNLPFAIALKTLLLSASGTMPLTYKVQAGMFQIIPASTTESTRSPFLTSDTDRYRFNKTISLAVLNNYLSRAVTHYGLCSTSPEPASACFDDDLRMLTGLGAKYIGRAAYAWVPPDDDEAHFRLAKERAEKVHQKDPDIILQACVFEAVYTSVGKIPVPAWVFEEFHIAPENRTFRYAAMLYEGGKYHNHWMQGASIPDMSKLETRMYFYYRARRYIDAGFEAIHFGQVHLMAQNDTQYRNWLDLLTRVRHYAARYARRELVLCDAHTHGIVTEGNRLLFDFHAWPQRPAEVKTSQSAAGVRPGKLMEARLIAGRGDTIYGQSLGGVTPSGWTCTSLPYLVEFDSFGSSGKGGQANVGFPWVWGYDEADWLAHTEAAIRASYLKYAWNWLQMRHENGWLQMPTRLNLAEPVDGNKLWHANTRSSDCPSGYSLEEAIKTVWDEDTQTRYRN